MNAPSKIEASMSGALVKALAEIEGAAKDKVNPHFKSKYADIASVIDAIKPVLAKHNLGFTQHSQPSEQGVIVETVLHHAGGEMLSMGSLYVPANKNDPQGFGSALTYARRYALMTAFGVPAEDDDGNAAVRSAEKVPGIHKIKERLNNLMREGDKCTDLAAFNELVGFHKDDLTKIKEANHEYWTGDGADSEGFKAWIKRRREELTPTESSLGYSMLLSALSLCATRNDLTALLDEHGAVAEALDGEESRRWEEAFNAQEAAIMAAAPLNA